MPRPRRADPSHAALLALLTVAVTLALVAAGGRGASPNPRPAPSAGSWRGLVGSRPRVAIGQRVIVLLKTPSLAQRVAAAGGRATDAQERRWTNNALAAQRLLLYRLAGEGVRLQPEHSFARVLDGFAAAVDPPGAALLERDPDVAGVYPVRPAYPASVSQQVLAEHEFAPEMGHRPDIGLSGIDGRGVTVALLDTGVDPTVPYLAGRVAPRGIDIVGGSPDAHAAAKPDDPSQLERHGTEMAGLIVGAGGPHGLAGVAPGATVLPIRVAGWQPDLEGHWSVYSRTDQLLAGLDRAVDPNGDGDAHDAARIAVVALSEPYAAFADGPEAQAVQGATALDTLVVASAGNDGLAGPGYGSISGPGGAPAALTVGALDTRVSTDEARIVVHAGLHAVFDGMLPLVGAVAPATRLDLAVAAPRGGLRTAGPATPRLVDFFDRSGGSIVAGRAALVSAGASPAPAAEHAATAGASAVLLYGSRPPAGSLGLDEDVPVPVVALPAAAAAPVLDGLRRGVQVGVSIGPARSQDNAEAGSVASFSSSGLAFDGRVKPDLVAPGVALATSDPGETADGSPRFATVNGSSAAAATVAGAAALLAQARPSLGASQLESLLVGAAAPVASSSVLAQGSGEVDAGGAAAAEVAAFPATLALSRSTGAGWHVRRRLLLQNLSTRAVKLVLDVQHTAEGAAAVDFSLQPRTLLLGRGRTATITIRARVVSQPSGAQPAEGAIEIHTLGGGLARVPWAIPFGPSSVDLLGAVHLSQAAFKPSDTAPALLVFNAGAVPRTPDGRQEVRPVQRLDIELVQRDGTDLGLLARLRDVLPGRYAFGLTGRNPTGGVLPTGAYVLRLTAWPTDGSRPTTRRVPFTVK
jgi:subtilisin family serine protease